MAETGVKAVKGLKSVVNNCTIAMPVQAPVVINNDDALTTAFKNAVKDVEGVTANVNDGQVTLTGPNKRSSLPNVMQAISTLKPKKINNQITIK